VVEHFRRTDPRYLRRLDVEISIDGKVLKVVSRNLSLGGIFVETAEALPLHTKVGLRFRVPAQPEPIEVTGEVRWIEKGSKPDQDGQEGPGVGIRFDGLRARDVWALNRFFQG
jgi:uncharacterized protein (TIGR02266 family)